MRFADFYAGAGGWSLGLTLAGHEQVMSAEIWTPANRTRGWNLGKEEKTIDVRALDPNTVPDCDLIVGSPPCTQFSYANKGGNGDIKDGLQDVRAFLGIVACKNPKYWIMENVPRLSEILKVELAVGGALEAYAHLFESIDDFDMSHWGVPQRRRRCIAGRYPKDLLLALKGRRPAPTLSEVVEACRTGIDPLWGTACSNPTDNDPGLSLTWEETRINDEKKRNHPIYNDMAFPDAPHRTARTVTATCTKVSRESIVVPDDVGGYRLLSIRESAAVQSFPLSYQFVSNGRSDRIKMAGNAIPPFFTYMIGLAVAGVSVPEVLPSFSSHGGLVEDAPKEKTTRRPGKSGRSFRAAIASLRFKSGMSFELRNGNNGWEIVFNSGGPGRTRVAGQAEISAAADGLAINCPIDFGEELGDAMQAAWETSTDCPTHPYQIIDQFNLIPRPLLASDKALAAVDDLYAAIGVKTPEKAKRHAASIAAGIALANAFNLSMVGNAKALAA